MAINIVSHLEDRFGIPGEVSFTEGPNGITVVEISNDLAAASIALQGAQILSWAPIAANPVLWLSPASPFGPGVAIRGGVPVCWPWFGPHDRDPKFPAHGFARTALWDVIESQAVEDGSTRLGFRLSPEAFPTHLWPHRSPVELFCTVGSALEVELRTHNEGKEPITLGEALHAYFQISDVRDIRVLGLENCRYIDKVDQGRRKQQQGAITFTGETDRIYLDTKAACVIDDPAAGRRILIEKQGSASTVVWNPGAERAAAIQGFGPDDYRHMVCVETANTADNVVTLAPGEEHRLLARYLLE